MAGSLIASARQLFRLRYRPSRGRVPGHDRGRARDRDRDHVRDSALPSHRVRDLRRVHGPNDDHALLGRVHRPSSPVELLRVHQPRHTVPTR